MINQYSFNLDAPQDYLVHGKLGAHYSKNWTKEKQNEYNKWYYQHNKDKWKNQQDAMIQYRLQNAKNIKDDINRSRQTEAEENWFANAHDKSATALEIASRNKYEAQEAKRNEYDNYTKSDESGSSYKSKAATRREIANLHRSAAASAANKRKRMSAAAGSRSGQRDLGYENNYSDKLKKRISDDKSSLSNIAKFEAERTASKASNAAKTTAKKASNAVKNIKSSISSVANKVLNPDDGRKTLSEYGYKKAKKNTKQISDRISFTTYD